MINAYYHHKNGHTQAMHALALFRAMNRREEVALINLGSTTRDVPPDVARMLLNGRRAVARDPSVGFLPARLLKRMAGARRIGIVVWEPTVVYPFDLAAYRKQDEIWSPSQFGRRVLIDNGLEPQRVHVVPGGVDAAAFRPLDRPRPDRPFRFLCVGKWEKRKAMDELIDAFCDEFRAGEPVELRMHCANPYLRGFSLEKAVARAVAGRPARVVASEPVMSLEGLVDLYNECDAFVLPTRGEGWGLPVAEAMACGLPVIVTNYSAPADYIDDEIAYPLRVESMIDVDDSDFFLPGAGQWAQPDFSHLRFLLRHVFENPAEAREKGRRAREAICSKWTWDHAAARACELLGVPA